MTFMEFYDKVEDQFTPDVLKELMNGYYDDYKRDAFADFYKYNPNFSYKEEFHNFEISMFNRFVNIMHSITNEEDALTYDFNDSKLFRMFFMKLIDKFKNVPIIHSYDEMEKYMDEVIAGESEDFKRYVNSLYRQFGIVKTDDYGYFIYSGCDSDDYSGENYKHSLTFNSLSVKDSNKIVSYFIDRCGKDNIPFRIDYTYNFNNRSNLFDDIINIHSSNDYLLKYIDYLNDFKKEYPEIVSRVGNPNMLFGKYDGWIGYLNNYIYKDLESSKGSNFYKNRLYLMRKVCFEKFESWLSNNINNTFNYNGVSYSFKEYLVHYFFDIMKSYSHDSDELLYKEIEESLDRNIKELVKKIENNNYINVWSEFPINYTQSGGLKWHHDFGLHTIFLELALNDTSFLNDCYETIREEYMKMGVNEKCCFVNDVIDEMSSISKDDFQEKELSNDNKDTNDLNKDSHKKVYDNGLNQEFLDLLQELKNSSYDRKERSKFVVRVEQIIDIYRNEIHNDSFADTLVKAFNNAQRIYEEALKKRSSKSLTSPKRGRHFESPKSKYFKSASLDEEKPVSLSEDMESKIDDEVNDRVQKINESVYKTPSQKVEEALNKKMDEINSGVDSGETLDSKIDDLSKYVFDLNKRRKEINEKFKDVWVSSDEDKFDKLLEEDNKTKALINEAESEIKRREKIRTIVDEQIAREEVTRDIEKFESDVNFVNNSDLTDGQKKLLVDQIYAEFDKYVDEHPEEKGRSR